MPSKNFNLEHLAELVNINLDKAEKKNLGEDLEDILDYVAKLQKQEGKKESLSQSFLPLRNVEREDSPPLDFEVKNSQKKDIKAQAPKTKNSYFIIPQVLKR